MDEIRNLFRCYCVQPGQGRVPKQRIDTASEIHNTSKRTRAREVKRSLVVVLRLDPAGCTRNCD
jgi:hypothetical protein